MTTFLDLAGDADVAAPPPPVAPAKKKVTFANLAGPPPKAPTFSEVANPAAMRADILAHGGSGAEGRALLAAFDAKYPNAANPPAPPQTGAGRGFAPASAYVIPRTGADAIPTAADEAGQPRAMVVSTPYVEPSPWQKLRAGGEAAANTAAGVVGGGAGMLYGSLEAIGKNAGRYVAGEAPVDVEQQAALRAGQWTPELPRALQTPLGQEYTANVGNALAAHGPALIGIGPELGMAGGFIRGRAQLARAEAAAGAGADAVTARGAATAPRVEPTFSETPQGGIPAPGAPSAAPAGGSAAPAPGAAPAAAMPPAVAAPAVAPAPTLAQASPQLQRAVAAMGGKAPAEAVARHVEAETLPVPGKLTTGQAAQDPALISSEMNSRGKGLAAPVPPEFYQRQGQTLAANMDAIRGTAAPDIPTSASIVDHGQTLLDAYKTKDAAVTADISAKYKALADANGGSLPVNGTDFVAAADAALAKQMKGRYVPKEIAADMEAFRQGGPMTFEDFENLRTNLAAEGRKADRAGDGNAAGAINIVRNSLEQLPITGETAAIKPLADAARSAAKARFDAIKADPAYKAAVNDATELGQPSPAADRFFNSYVRDAARENVARMRANLEDHPQATQTIAAGILDHLKGQLKADPVTGNFSQATYNKALQTLGPKMASLVDPTTAQQLQAVGGFAKNAQTQPRGSYVNNSNTAVELAAQGAKAAAEHGTNVLFGGIPVGTVTRKVGGYIADRAGMAKASNQALDPSAGLARLSDLVKKGPP